MKELIELRKYYLKEIENIDFQDSIFKSCYHIMKKERIGVIKREIFLEFLKKLDLILENSVVKPTERRSPTDESFGGCKPPERKAKSTDKDLICNTCLKLISQEEGFNFKGKCVECYFKN